MKKNNKQRLKTNDKIGYFIIFLAFLFILLLYRLAKLQIFDVYDYRGKGREVARAQDLIKPDRGEIYDRNGKPLAITQKSDDVYMLKTIFNEEKIKAEKLIKDKDEFSKLSEEEQKEVREQSESIIIEHKDIKNISDILGIDEKKIIDNVNNRNEGFIARSISSGTKRKIENLGLSFIQIIGTNHRYYPNNEILSKTLGFIDENGSGYGLEKYYDDLLTGKTGYREVYTAVRGTAIPFEDKNLVDPEKASNLVITIDEDLQKILYNSLRKVFLRETPKTASALLMDPNTGEILAMESLPNFNPNKPRDLNSDIDKMFLSRINPKEQDKYMISRWMNENVSMTYEPGSVFKSITTAIGLESKPELEKTLFYCEGQMEIVPGVTIRCTNHAHMFENQTMKQAFSNSCNTSYVKIIRTIDKENFVNYGTSLRFGAKTNIDLPEEYPGVFPENSDIKDVDFAPMSYGHSLSVTPVQILSALNATVNGGNYYRPHLISKIVDDNFAKLIEFTDFRENQVISEETSKKMRELFKFNASEMSAFTDSDLNIGAKTGTTVKISSTNPLRTEDIDSEVNIVSIFMSYPIDAPRYSLLVVVDEPLKDPRSTTTAAQLGLDIFENINLFEKKEKIGQAKIDNLKETPNLIGKTLELAKKELDEYNIPYDIKDGLGNYHIISDQFPEAGSQIDKNVKLILGQKENDKKIQIPSFKGEKVSRIIQILEENKINYELKGQGKYVTGQSSSGQVLESNETIIIEANKE